MSAENGTRSYKLEVWRQDRGASSGRMVLYQVAGIDPNMSFLEMFDQLNEDLLRRGEDPVAIDSDCREGICGTCGVCIDGRPHGPLPNVTTCSLRMREFPDGST
ncbi:MAG: 2Fe-2S iron-sulfur cluster-binding protein, partial [Alphaproteobacteria bacterium]